jgi:hypothetical protein
MQKETTGLWEARNSGKSAKDVVLGLRGHSIVARPREGCISHSEAGYLSAAL